MGVHECLGQLEIKPIKPHLRQGLGLGLGDISCKSDTEWLVFGLIAISHHKPAVGDLVNNTC